jgi:transcriptional regulator with XRE-family HTH domain
VPRLKKPSNPDVERKIAARFAELREMWGLSLSKFAKEIELTRDQVSNIERGRSPLRYVNAARALRADRISEDRQPYLSPFNPLWLFGASDCPIQMDWPMLLPDPVAIGLDLTTRFSDFVTDNSALLQSLSRGWVELPESWLAPYFKHWSALQARADRVEKETFALMETLIVSTLDLAPVSAPARRLLEQIRLTSVKASNFLIVLDSARRQKAPHKQSANQVLTKVSEYGKTSDMKSPMRNLLDRLKRATSERGTKTVLAAYMKVKPANISQWLSGEREPSGETTLKLLHWVEQQERQQTKSPGSAATQPEPKTQLRKPYEKKPKSSPQER